MRSASSIFGAVRFFILDGLYFFVFLFFFLLLNIFWLYIGDLRESLFLKFIKFKLRLSELCSIFNFSNMLGDLNFCRHQLYSATI